MRIIIAYASAGSGHRRAAEAIYRTFEKKYPEINTSLIDILDYTNSLFANLYSQGYSLLVTHLKFIWAIGYRLTCLKSFRWFFNFICCLNCFRFGNLIVQEQPDIVLATHFFPAEIISYLKKRGKLSLRLITIMTDFGVHPFWVFEDCDDYIVGSDYTCNHLVLKGINPNKIKVLGIPISSEFPVNYRRDRQRQGFTALLVTGSFGFSLIEKIVDMVYSEINLLVVCGNNQRLYNRLKRKHYAGAQLFGFTKEMPRLMSQADIIVTKPGGLTIAEALAMELPIIFIGGIPGQETENARVLEACGCAIRAKRLKDIKDIILDLKAHSERLALMRVNIQRFKKPNASEETCRYVMGTPYRLAQRVSLDWQKGCP